MFSTAKAFIFGNPWMILAVVAGLAASHGYAYITGGSHERGTIAKEQLIAERKYQADYQKAIERGNEYAKQLVSRETEIVYRTKEVIRNVTQVTTGKPCLSDAALRMLNYRPGNAAVPEAPSKPIAEDATAATIPRITHGLPNINALAVLNIGRVRLCAGLLDDPRDNHGASHPAHPAFG